MEGLYIVGAFQEHLNKGSGTPDLFAVKEGGPMG